MKKKMIMLILTITVMLILCACNKTETNIQEYKEEIINVPEEICWITDVIKLESCISIAGSNDDNSVIGIWESQDQGVTWEKKIDIVDLLNDRKVANSDVSIKLSPNGQNIILVSTDEHDYVYLMKSDNEIIELEKSFVEYIHNNYITSLDYLNESKILCISMFGIGTIYDVEKNTYQELELKENEILSYKVIDGMIYLLTDGGMKKFDSDGNAVSNEQLEVLNEYVDTLNIEDEVMFTIDEKKDKLVTIVDSQQILRFTGNQKQVLIERVKTSLGDTNNYLSNMFTLTDGSVLLLVQTETGSMLSKLVQVDKILDKKTLTIYSLENNTYLQQMAYLYQKEHPEVDVILEVGRESEDVTREDALKGLNSRLIGGIGPDVVLLEGLPQKKYVEQGFLEDMHTFVEEQVEKEDLFSSVVTSYCVDEKQYGVPVYFSMMTISSVYDLENVDSLEQFINYLGNCKLDVEKPVFENWSYDQIVSMMYRLYMSNFEEGTIENAEERVEEFYSAILQSYNLVDMTDVEESGKNFSNIALTPLGYNNFDLIFTEDVQVAVDYIVIMDDIKKVQLMKDNNYSCSFVNNVNDILCIPTMTLGVINQKDKKEIAKDFIAFALSEEVQNEIIYSGLSVNKATMTQRLKNMSDEEIVIETELGTTRELHFSELEQDEINSWLKIFENAKCVSMLDYKIFQFVMEQADGIVKNELTVEEATQEACRKINLYLNE